MKVNTPLTDSFVLCHQYLSAVMECNLEAEYLNEVAL